MDVSLSDEQMLSVIPKANFIPYDKLINMRDIHEVLGPNGISIILYLTSDNYGHWVCLFLRDKGLEGTLKKPVLSYFNSYGSEPDDDFKFIPPMVRVRQNEVEPILYELMANSGYDCEYSNYTLQKYGKINGKEINTCGRHVICRLWNTHLDPDTYAKMLREYAKKCKCSTDSVVVKMTNDYIL